MESPEAQELFAREYPTLFDAVYRYVVYRLGDRDEAQDVVSEVFTKGFSKLKEFDPEKGSLKQWLTGIAKYELLMHWREQKKTISLEEEFLPSDSDRSLSLDQSLDQHLLAEKIYAQLSESTKRLLTLRYVDGYSYEELSQLTGKEPATLRQFFSRIHRSLRFSFHDPFDV